MIRFVIAELLVLLFFSTVNAQSPVNWNFDSKKIGDKLYEVYLTAEVEEPWHIYSQTTPSGGALPTSITFSKNPLITLENAIKEKGKLVKKFEKVFAMEVKYFEGSVTFIQTVKLKVNAKTNLSGNLEYMVCDDEKCLPPQKLSFNIPLL